MDHHRATLRQRTRRKFRVRKRFQGTAQRPRLSVFRSHKNVYAQVIDDQAGKTLVSASSQDRELRDQIKNGGNVEAAQVVGKALAEKAIAQGISQACFDRGRFKYHGRVAALADAAREAGLQF